MVKSITFITVITSKYYNLYYWPAEARRRNFKMLMVRLIITLITIILLSRSDSMPQYKLTYFNLKARGEVARMLFEVAVSH